MQEDKTKEEIYERCVVCGKLTNVRKDTHIDYRIGYIEGAGQTCPEGCKKDPK